MERRLLFAAGLLHVLTGVMASDCPPVGAAVRTYYRPQTGTCYYEWPGQMSFHDARDTCVDHGLKLVRLEELDEQQWLNTQTSKQHWLGLSKSTGAWKWIHNGSAVSETDPRWVGGTTGVRGYKHTATTWAKTGYTSSYSVICELEATSASTSTTKSATTTLGMTTTTETLAASWPASPETNGTSCSGLRGFQFHKFAEDYLETSLITSPVKSILECGVKCLNDRSCRGVRVVLHQELCALLSPSAVYNMCPTDSVCYEVVDDSNCF